MTIKSWVLPPVAIALSELQAEFGCNPLPPTTTTTLPLQPTTTTSTTSTSTTTTSTTTTLAPNTYNPSISVKGRPVTLKSGSQIIYTDPGLTRGPTYIFIVSGAPPGATFTLTITYASGSPVTINDTVPPSGVYETNPEASGTWPLGALTVVITFTPLVGQTVVNGNTRTLETSVVVLTSSTTSTTSTTTIIPVFAGLCRSTFNNYPPSTGLADYDPLWYTFRTPIERSVTTINGPINFSPFIENFSMEWVGYFVPAATGGHIFYIDAVDDLAMVWVGPYAESGYTRDNASAKSFVSGSTVASEMIQMTAGQRYAIRIQYAQGPSVKAFDFKWSGPGQAKTNDFTGRLFYATCPPINFITSTTTTTTTTTTTVATLTGQAAQTNASGVILDLFGSFSLPGVPVKLMFRLIGGGGSGGGADAIEGVGGSGGGGTVILGEVTLPDTGATPKILKAGIGLGGQPAKSIDSSGTFGLGGQGFSFPLGAGYSANGGNGAPANPVGRSGAGGGGGGASALFVSLNGTLYGIASAGGGGGGGGGSNRIPANDATNNTTTPIGYQAFSSMDGFSGVQRAGVDGGGGGGGGGGRGTAGVSATGDTYPTATGGSSGLAVQNTSVGLSLGSWSKFEVYQPPATMASGNWAKVPYIAEWTGFMNKWAVFDVYENLVDTKSSSFPLYFPQTTSYSYEFAADNTATFSIDGTVIRSISNNYNSATATGTFSVTAGYRNFTISMTNVNGPGGVALRIWLNDIDIFTSLDLVQNRNLAVDPAIAGNHGYFGRGGNGSNQANVISDAGTSGAVAVYWTTNLSETWDINKLPILTPSTYYIQSLSLPASVSTDSYAYLMLQDNGWYFSSESGWAQWSTPAFSGVGALYEAKIDPVSGDLGNLNPPNQRDSNYNLFSPKAVWQTISSTPLLIGLIGGTAVARVSIRRKSDNVVAFTKDITLTVTVPYDSGGGGGGDGE